METRKLISVTELFKKSFNIYQNNINAVISLMAINALAFFIGVPFLLVALFAWFRNTMLAFCIFLSLFVAFAIIGTLLSLCAKIAILYLVKDQNVSAKIAIRQLLQDAWDVLGSYIWVSILIGLAVFCGIILFIIPGIIFAVSFSLSIYVLIFEGKKGTLALKRSRELVKGYWWAVLGRFLVFSILGMFVSYIPLFGPLIMLLFIVPFGAMYGYSIYEDLAKIKA